MGFFLILGCLFGFGLKSIVGAICSIPLWVALVYFYKRLRRQNNHSVERLHKFAVASVSLLMLGFLVYFFAALDLSRVYAGVFNCPQLTADAGFYWPAALAAVLLAASFTIQRS